MIKTAIAISFFSTITKSLAVTSKNLPEVVDIRGNPENPQTSLSDDSFYNYYGGLYSSSAGVDVTPASAMRLATVYACVNLLSETLASLPIYVYRREGARKIIDEEHPINQLLVSPNENTDDFNLRYAAMVHVLLQGNAFILIERNGLAEPLSMRLLTLDEISTYVDTAKNIRYFYGGTEIPAYNIIHLRGFTYDSLMGVSPISYARETMGMGLAAEQFGGKFFANGANMSGVLETPGKVTDAQRSYLSEVWHKQYSGSQNAHKTAILEGGLNYKRISITPKDAMFIETRKFNKKEICGIFRVPPHMVADMEEATFSNIEHQDLSFVKHTLRPWIKRWELELTKKLFTTQQVRRRQYFLRYDLDDMMRGDVAARASYLRELRYAGALNGNEIREMEDFNPAGPELDRYWMPTNMIPADKVDEYINRESGTNSNTDAA